jgi:hypothetical protein
MLETKRASMEWQYKDSPPPKKGEDYILCSESYGQYFFGSPKAYYSLIF